MKYIYKLDNGYLDWGKISSRTHFYYPAIINIKLNDIVYLVIDSELGEATCLMVEVSNTDLKGIQYYNEALKYLDSSIMMSLEQTFLEFQVIKKSYHNELNIYNLQNKGFIFESSNLIKRIGKHIKFFEQIESLIDINNDVDLKLFPLEKEILSFDRQKQDYLYATIKTFVNELDKMSFEKYASFYASSREIGFLTNLFYDERYNIWYSKEEVIDFPDVYFKVFKNKFLKEKKYPSVLSKISLAVKNNQINLFIVSPAVLIKLAIYLEVNDNVRDLYDLNIMVYKALLEILPNFELYDKNSISRSIYEWSKTIELSEVQIEESNLLIKEFQIKIPESPFLPRFNHGLIDKEFEENSLFLLKNNHYICVTLPVAFKENYFVNHMMYHFNLSESDSYFTDMKKLEEVSRLKPYKKYMGLITINRLEKDYNHFNNNVYVIYLLKSEQIKLQSHINYHIDLVIYKSELTLEMLKLQLENYHFNELEVKKLIDIFNEFNNELPIKYHLPTHYYYSYPWDNGLNFNQNLDIIINHRLKPLKDRLNLILLKENLNEN